VDSGNGQKTEQAWVVNVEKNMDFVVQTFLE
jgi:hypothetical protein